MTLRSRWIPAVVLLVAALLLIGSAANHSLTVDEAKYIGLGKRLLETGDWRTPAARLHPPLPYYLNSVLFFGRNIPDSVWNADHQDERGRELCRVFGGQKALLLARLPIISVTLLLLLLVYLEARRAFGPKGGTIALLLAAFDPELLAHGSLATPDLPLAATFLWAVLRFRRAAAHGGAKNLALAGVALGVALLSKYTAVLLFGILPVTALLAGARGRLAVRTPIVFAVALVVLHAGYLPFYLYGAEPHAPFSRGVFPNPYGAGIEQQRAANEGHRSYFFGEIKEGGWVAYYPVALLVKTPIPLLLLAAAGAWLALRSRDRSRAAWLLAPPALLLLFFMFISRINIGVRYVLPVVPFFALLGGFAASRAETTWRGRVVWVLVFWQIAAVAAAYPHFLTYFNEAAGGTNGGARVLADSNIDWGQDLPGLARWLDRRGADGCYLAYFGNGDPSRYGIRYRFLPGWLYTLPMSAYRESVGYFPAPDLVAVSRMDLQGVWLPERDLYSWLEKYPRVASIGGSILVYDIGNDPDAHDRIAAIYKRAAKIDLFRDEMVHADELRRHEGGGRP